MGWPPATGLLVPESPTPWPSPPGARELVRGTPVPRARSARLGRGLVARRASIRLPGSPPLTLALAPRGEGIRARAIRQRRVFGL
jgi:hypothetical protein